jgi:hypothetical protein
MTGLSELVNKTGKVKIDKESESRAKQKKKAQLPMFSKFEFLGSTGCFSENSPGWEQQGLELENKTLSLQVFPFRLMDRAQPAYQIRLVATWCHWKLIPVTFPIGEIVSISLCGCCCSKLRFKLVGTCPLSDLDPLHSPCFLSSALGLTL